MKKALWFIFLVFLIFIYILDDSNTGGGGVLLFLFLMFSGTIWLIRHSIKIHKKRKIMHEDNILNHNVRAAFCKGRHIAGLPIAHNVPCEIEAYSKKLFISSGGYNFEIPMERIINASRYDDYQIQQYQKTSLGKALLGGLTFGGVGAVIGAMPQTKDKKVVSGTYLVVDYISSEDIASSFVVLLETWVVNEDIVDAINNYKKGSKANLVL